MPGSRLAHFDTDGLALAGEGAQRNERLIPQAVVADLTFGDRARG